MIEIDHTTGETRDWRAVPRTSTGAPPDLTGVEAELRIAAPGACVPVAGAGDGTRFSFSLSPQTLDLPVGRYAAALWIRWADGGWRSHGRAALIVRKGC